MKRTISSKKTKSGDEITDTVIETEPEDIKAEPSLYIIFWGLVVCVVTYIIHLTIVTTHCACG